MGENIEVIDDWTTFRPRAEVAACRLAKPAVVGGRMFHDGYLVKADDRLIVVGAGVFEAIYEPS